MATPNEILLDIHRLTNEFAATTRAYGILLRALIATHHDLPGLEKKFLTERERGDVDALYRPLQDQALSVFEEECERMLTTIRAGR